MFAWTARGASGETVAFLPFRVETRRPLSLRRAVVLGDGTFDSDYLEPPIRRGLEEPIVDAWLDAISARRGVEVAMLFGLPEGSPTLAALRTALARRRTPSRSAEVLCATAALPQGFDAYVAGLKPRMRSKVRSAMRGASERGASMRWCHDPTTLPAHLDGLYALHTKRWIASGKPGSFGDEKRRRFYGAVAPALLAGGRLRFARLELEGRAIAYQLGAVAAGAYYQIQEGFDPADAALRPGVALRGFVIRSLVDEGVSRYDFLEGFSEHKADWGGLPRKCFAVAFPLRSLRARAIYGLRRFLR
ncbi:MAG TPA: GNAT family N-acetyltransferase [Planctomycetota bacterium]|nr:GNAT family N-acetyltransferase [Planctomycetota bacterium]